MTDIKSPKLLWIKGGLFLVIGIVSASLLLVESFSWRRAALLVLAIWGFCRAYYFAFYVIEHYVDPGYRFAGLIAFMRYALSERRSAGGDADNPPEPPSR